jgi:type IV secretory pathway TraG/TraD family ATPase VirD4
MLPQEIKEMPADRQLLFVEHVLPVKCEKIRYFDDPIFTKRLLPPPGVKQQDVSAYVGGRTDDHFAMWQERLGRERPSPVARQPDAHAAPVDESDAIAPQAPSAEFSLDFSAVKIPPGRYLTGPELEAAVHSFLDELETA